MAAHRLFLVLCALHAAQALSPLFTTAPPELTSPEAAAAHTPRRLCEPPAAPGAAWRCRNWAGSVEWAPREVVQPESEVALSAFLAAEAQQASAAAPAARPRRPFKVMGSAHSWAPIFVPAGSGAPASATASSARDQQQCAPTDAAFTTNATQPAGGAAANAAAAAAGAAVDGGVTIALHRLTGITKLIPPPAPGAIGYVEVLTGTTFAELFERLHAAGLALLVPPGGIMGLTVGGAVSVGFHGSQSTLGGASSGVVALRVVDANGTAFDLSEGTHPEAMRAARLSLGMCGVLTRVTMPVVAQFHLKRRRWRVDGAAAFLDGEMGELKERYDRFHYYVHPASDSAWPMYWEPTTPEASAAEGRPCVTALEQLDDAKEKEFGPDGLPLILRWDNCSDVSHKSLTHAVDMEAQPLWNGELYLPLPADPAAAATAEAAAIKALMAKFEAVAANINGKPAAGGRSGVHPDLWVHVRYVAGDTTSYLNPCYGAGHCAAVELALVAHAMDDPLPPWGEWDPYFTALQDVLLPLGGRPHAAKFHSIQPSQLVEPAFGLPAAAFAAECRKFDPERLMRDERLDALLGLGDA